MSHNPTRFLILGMQRSGTTVLHQLVGGHPDVGTNPREFGSEFFKLRDGLAYHNPEAISPDPSLRDRLFDTWCALPQRDAPYAALGAKVAFPSAAMATQVTASIRSDFRNFKVILISRDAPLNGLVSLKRAQSSHVWHHVSASSTTLAHPSLKDKSQSEKIEKSDAKEKYLININESEIIKYIWHWSRINDALVELAKCVPSLSLSYEADLLDGNILQGGKVFDFLDVSRLPVTWITMEKIGGDLSDEIENAEWAKAFIEAIQPIAQHTDNEAEFLIQLRPLLAGREARRLSVGDLRGVRRRRPRPIVTRVTSKLIERFPRIRT